MIVDDSERIILLVREVSGMSWGMKSFDLFLHGTNAGVWRGPINSIKTSPT